MTSISADAVSAVLAMVLPAPVTVADLHPLSGGASADTWSFDATDAGGAHHALILRRNAGRGGISLVRRKKAGANAPRAAGACSDGFSLPRSRVMDKNSTTGLVSKAESIIQRSEAQTIICSRSVQWAKR